MKTYQGINCSNEEAVKISGQMELTQMLVLKDLFREFYNKHLAENCDASFAQWSAISDIFTLGYVSGIRTERNKKNKADR